MTCEELPAEDLVAWLDGELAGPDAQRVEAHLAACAACRREAGALRESGALLACLAPAPPPSAGFSSRVVAAARLERSDTGAGGRLVFLRPRLLAGAAAVLVGVTAGALWIASDRGEVLTSHDEEAIVADLVVLSNLDALQTSEAKELAQLADDLDVLDALAVDDELEKGR